jgi:heptosyltransferase II
MELRRILFIAEGQLGDLLILTPALRATKKTFPSAFISVLLLQRRRYDSPDSTAGMLPVYSPHGGTAVVLLANPNVDEVLEIDRHALRSLRGAARIRSESIIVREIRKRNFESVVCTFPQDRFVLWAYASGAKVRVGQRRQALWRLLTHTPDILKSDGGVLKYYCNLVSAIGAKAESFATEYSVPEIAQQRAAELLDARDLKHVPCLIAVHPGASGSYRIWPPERYAALIDLLQARSGCKVLLCGSVFDQQAVSEVKRRVRTNVEVINTGESVAELAALLQKCALCISNNSGPRHLAIAVGVPSLAIIPQFDDREWKIYEDDRRCATLQGTQRCPACPPGRCLNLIPENESYGSHCMRMIEPGTVLSKTNQILAFY